MRCAWCGKEFRPSQARQKYDSEKCRVAAWRAARKDKPKKTPRKPASHAEKKPAKSMKRVVVPVSGHVAAELTEGDFDRMMTDDMQQALTFSAKVLRRALEDADTPANALAPITREYLGVVEKLDQMSGPELPGLDLDGGQGVDETVDTGKI